MTMAGGKAELRRQAISLRAGFRSLVVTQDGKAVGLLTLHGVKEVPQAEWPTSTVAQVMMSMDQVKRVGSDTEL